MAVADATAIPLRASTVDLIVSSPPYFNLRSYSGHPQEIGREDDVESFVAALVASLREMVRVLKPTGSIFINLSDRYGDGRHGPLGNLMLIPHQFALAARAIEGLVLRAEIVWHKPTGIPENQATRVRRTHEYWFHFTTSPTYYCDANAIRDVGPSGAMSLPSSVQSVVPEPYPNLDGHPEHPATFPVAWPREFILGWSPPGWCLTCEQPLRTTADKTVGRTQGRARRRIPGYRDPGGTGHRDVTYTVTGHACNCDETGDTRPSVVLDPFGGSGTTAQVAAALGRYGLSFDISEAFCRLASDPCLIELRRAGTLALKPIPVDQSQEALF